MSIRQQTNSRARLFRKITVEGNIATVDDDLDTGWKNVQVLSPDSRDIKIDESPRNMAAYWISWAAGYKGFPEVPEPGWRLELASGGLYELLEAPEALKESVDTTSGWKARAQLVSLLYPIQASWTQQDGTAIEGGIELAVWNEEDDQRQQGRYDTLAAECPIEYEIKVNQRVDFQERAMNIVRADTVIGRPRRTMVLKAPSG